MPESSDRPLAVVTIAAALGSLAARFDVDVVAECDSTNTRLLARADCAPSGTVLVAERQTAGRGRMGRKWHAEPEASLTFSLLHKLPRGAVPSGLSLAVGVGIAGSEDAVPARAASVPKVAIWLTASLPYLSFT